MGRHADPDRRAFWGSFAVAVGKAVLALAVIGTITALVASMAGPMGEARGPTVMIAESPDTPDATAAPTTPTSVTPTPTPTLATPQATASPTAAATDAADPTPSPTPSPTPTPAPADVAGVTVQILNSGASAAAVDEVEALLADWGYDIVAAGPGRCCYDTTTVFYSEGRQADAEALAERDPRFVVVELNTDLDQSVYLHVVLGEDWSSREP